VQSQKAEIFRISKRHITNQKMIDNWGNAKTALPLPFAGKRIRYALIVLEMINRKPVEILMCSKSFG
jgi:hypothetical protein